MSTIIEKPVIEQPITLKISNNVYKFKFNEKNCPEFQFLAGVRWPAKDNKISFFLYDNDCTIENLNKSIKSLVSIDFNEMHWSKINTNCKGVKDIEKFKKNDLVKITIKFNNCFEYSGKLYPSFKLKEIFLALT